MELDFLKCLNLVTDLMIVEYVIAILWRKVDSPSWNANFLMTSQLKCRRSWSTKESVWNKLIIIHVGGWMVLVFYEIHLNQQQLNWSHAY